MDRNTAPDGAQEFDKEEKFETAAVAGDGGLGESRQTLTQLIAERAARLKTEAMQADARPENKEDVQSEMQPSTDAPAEESDPALEIVSVAAPVMPFAQPVPALLLSAAPFARPAAPQIAHREDTEYLLNGLIAEIHLLMRDVATPSAAQVYDANTRMHFLSSAMDMARTGATVGLAVAKLRRAGQIEKSAKT